MVKLSFLIRLSFSLGLQLFLKGRVEYKKIKELPQKEIRLTPDTSALPVKKKT